MHMGVWVSLRGWGSLGQLELAGAGWSWLELVPQPSRGCCPPRGTCCSLGGNSRTDPWGRGEQQPLCHRAGVAFRLPHGAPGAASGGGVGWGETHPGGRLAADRDLRRRRRGVCARDDFCLEAGGVEESVRMKEQ